MAKDSKALLKEAKKLLTEKEYLNAIKICKKVLKEDKRNYNALVLMGASMRDIDDLKTQVPIALKKAIDVQPDNPLAWHGLLAYYEKQPPTSETYSELIPVYRKLLQLESDLAKIVQYLKNLSEAVLKLTNDVVLSDTIAVLCQLKEKEDTSQEAIKATNETITSILIQYPRLTNDYDEILEQALLPIIEDESSVNRHEYYKRYLKLLYKLENFNKLLSKAIKMHKIFNQDIYPLEWICRVYSELSIVDIAFDEIDIVIYYETLLDHDPESILGYFAQAVYAYKSRYLIDARNILNNLVSFKPKWFHAWYLLGVIDVMLYCWEDAECAALHALKLIPEGDPYNLLGRINVILLEALVKSPTKLKWKKAEMLFDELSDNSSKCAVLRAHLCVMLRDPQANDLITNLKNNPDTITEAIILHATDLLLEKHLEEAADVLSPVLETSSAWLTLGKIHWEMADYGHSLLAFLKGISADENNWECLVYMGKYHQEQTQDYERSQKCYQKALQINSNSDQAGIGLSLVYRLTKHTEANIEFLNRLTSQSRGPKWAFLQLGLQYLDNGDTLEAISILRNATKIDPNDSNCWECLGDAYFKRGAYLSAEKSYERAVELKPNSFYSMTQIANIKLLVGQYTLAKSNYVSILEKSKENVVALKGLAECCFKLGKEHAKEQLLARARDDFQEAVDFSTKALMQKSNFLSNWKLLGDVCFTISQLPDKYCYLNVISDLIQSGAKEDYIMLNKKEILLLSIRCFCRALSISKNSSLLWHDLALCYLAQARLISSKNQKDDILNKSLAAAKEAVKLDPFAAFHWNLLGVICMSNEIKNYALAQHSFAMAIEKESNNAAIWTNLGTLYYLLGDPYRANEAFSWAQKGDPAYVNCWIGQSLIAEQFSQKDAMDLFRHAAQLSYHHEAATGYAHWVLKTVMDPESKKDLLYNYVIEKMHAVAVASDSMSYYTAHVPTDSHALNAYGLLLERQKLYKSAAEQFSNALKHLEDDKHKDEISINLARVMVQQQKYEDSVKICLSIKESSFASHCQLALSLFKAEHFKESYEAYEAALHWLADAPSDKAHVLCAMAAMAYMFQESDDAKTLLYQSIAIKPPIISGLLALAALGMLDGDKNLTHLVFKELKAHDDHPEYKYHIAKLTAYLCLIQNDMEGASRILCKYIHRYPDSSELWTNLAKILLTMSDINPFYKCVDKALFLGKDLSNEHIAKIKCMSSLSKLITLSTEEGLRSVLNTVHSFPANIDSWSILITTLIPRWSKVSQFNAHWLMVLASRVRNTLSCTRNMEQWLLKNEKLANDIAYC